ncbi:hypothetical protein OG21DRAFT_1206244 [Imleria badia]|nr:hypothetical protein OG21DRAFT_1206244 [Imleria badia]
MTSSSSISRVPFELGKLVSTVRRKSRWLAHAKNGLIGSRVMWRMLRSMDLRTLHNNLANFNTGSMSPLYLLQCKCLTFGWRTSEHLNLQLMTTIKHARPPFTPPSNLKCIHWPSCSPLRCAETDDSESDSTPTSVHVCIALPFISEQVSALLY